MTAPKRMKPKDIEVGMEMDRFDGRKTVWDEIIGRSEPYRRYGNEGDWVYKFTVRKPDGMMMDRIVSANDRATVRGGGEA